jgi:hypothetical protein
MSPSLGQTGAENRSCLDLRLSVELGMKPLMPSPRLYGVRPGRPQVPGAGACAMHNLITALPGSGTSESSSQLASVCSDRRMPAFPQPPRRRRSGPEGQRPPIAGYDPCLGQASTWTSKPDRRKRPNTRFSGWFASRAVAGPIMMTSDLIPVRRGRGATVAPGPRNGAASRWRR